MSFTPYDHQARNSQVCADAIRKYGSAIDMSDVGTGKTYSALLTAKTMGARPAIVCPLATIPDWQKSAKVVGVDPLFVENYECHRRNDFTLGTFRGNTFWWDKVPTDSLMVFDEVHRCRGDTTNSKMLVAAAYRCRTLLLSATPFTSPLEARSIGMAMRLFTGHNFMSWARDHGVRRGRWGESVFRGGPEELLKIHNRIFNEGRGCRTRASEIPGFPETLILPWLIEGGHIPEIAKAYEAELQERLAEAEGRAANPMLMGRDPGVFVPLLRFRQLAELNKCVSMAEMAQDLSAQGYKVAIFVNFDHSVELLKKMLKTDCTITGADHGGLRQNRCIRFQWGKENYMILNSQAGGTGINLHDLSGNKQPRASIISPGWSALDFKQVLGRVHRVGGGYSVQRIACLADTIEESVINKLGSKLSNLDALVDGDLLLPGEDRI